MIEMVEREGETVEREGREAGLGGPYERVAGRRRGAERLGAYPPGPAAGKPGGMETRDGIGS